MTDHIAAALAHDLERQRLTDERLERVTAALERIATSLELAFGPARTVAVADSLMRSMLQAVVDEHIDVGAETNSCVMCGRWPDEHEADCIIPRIERFLAGYGQPEPPP